ncbi:hypothetical protein B0O80DRAFT_20175 [Mortierella sp. GBAus27b]|nr:hypothetical protein B0O80DRAFT_20175 [Mortierella sp. GBAus27b]
MGVGCWRLSNTSSALATSTVLFCQHGIYPVSSNSRHPSLVTSIVSHGPTLQKCVCIAHDDVVGVGWGGGGCL